MLEPCSLLERVIICSVSVAHLIVQNSLRVLLLAVLVHASQSRLGILARTNCTPILASTIFIYTVDFIKGHDVTRKSGLIAEHTILVLVKLVGPGPECLTVLLKRLVEVITVFLLS